MANGGVKIIRFNTGYCLGPGKVTYKTNPWKKIRFSAGVFLIRTEKYGNILFDSGYAKTYFTDINPLYNWLLPVHFSTADALKKQLKDQNIELSDISYIFISHFHVDHIAGLKDLKEIPWIYRKEPLLHLLEMGRLRALKHGFFKNMLPNIPKGSIALDENEFQKGFLNSNLRAAFHFKNTDLQAVDLPGHALGQMGLYAENMFFIADAVWSKESLVNNTPPSFWGLLLQENWKKYMHTFQQIQKLRQENPKLVCIPSHEMEQV